jgi:hypothetical protein
MTTAISVLAFTVVLGEAFAAVGLSTLIPAMFVETCRAMKVAGPALDALLDENLPILMKALPLPGLPAPTNQGPLSQTEAGKLFIKAIKRLIEDPNFNKMQLLVPNSAKIDATFACGGCESYGVNAGAEGVIQVVGIKAGFSAMFELHSSTSVHLEVTFAPVEYTL